MFSSAVVVKMAQVHFYHVDLRHSSNITSWLSDTSGLDVAQVIIVFSHLRHTLVIPVPYLRHTRCHPVPAA